MFVSRMQRRPRLRTHGAFASSFQGQKQDGKMVDGKIDGTTWKPNNEIQRQADEKIEGSGKLREIIERIRKRVAKAGKDKKDTTSSSKDTSPEASN
ncbi:MAG: hypothetical protein M1840_007846 [Geoglossum simile]|nr:MAG: hypothetical protein M1840_007846 [Geoglossum simile]